MSVTSGARPGLIYDYGGFPPHTYELTYPAPVPPSWRSGSSNFPLMVAAGAGSDQAGFRSWVGEVGTSRISAWRFN